MNDKQIKRQHKQQQNNKQIKLQQVIRQNDNKQVKQIHNHHKNNCSEGDGRDR